MSQQWLIDEIAHYIVHSDRLFRAKLDKTTADLERQHRAALEDAQLQHAAILAGAKDALDDARRLHAEEAERIRRRSLEAQQREDEERAARDDYERRLAEANARMRAETERLHAQRAEELRRVEELAAARAREAEAAERARREAEQQSEAEQQTKAVAHAPAPVVVTARAVQPVDAPVDTGSPLVRWDRLEQEHNEYLQLHKKLKEMRKHMVAMYKQANASKGRDGVGNPPIQEMANWRRSLQKLLGQLTSEPPKNRQVRGKIQEIFRQAWNNTGVALDARDFIIRPEQPFPAGVRVPVSGTFVYLLNMLVKSAISLMLTAATTTSYNAIDPIGVVLSWIASHSEFRLHGNSLVDVYLAKYHATAPVLFGVYGSESTAAGRTRLRWRRAPADEEGREPGWVGKQAYYDRLHGACVGWAALSLRDFSRVKGERSALPAWRFWAAVAALVNVPPRRLQRSHAVALRALVDQYAHLFVKFYGQAAMAALRRAIVDVPAGAPAEAGFEMVAVVRDNLRTKYGLVL